MIKKFLIYMLITLSIIIISFTIFLYIKAPMLFKPKHKVIQYQEEVKLSDGSMIWVDIKRHYWLSGGAVGDGGMFTRSYVPGVVEISWDTGFEGVGRQSVFFDKNLSFIDKIDDIWYVVGQKYPYAGTREGIAAPNCQDIGIVVNAEYDCVFRINKQGEIIRIPIKARQLKNIQMNILYAVGIKDWESIPEPLDKSRITWINKIELQQTQSDERQVIGRPYSYDFITSSNGGEL